MSLTIRLTSDMSAEDMAPLWPGIIRCLEKYVRRFPKDETVENIIAQCASGRRQLWVVQDGDGAVVLAAVTEILKMDATGKNRMIFAECAGSRIGEVMPLITQMEQWAADERQAVDAEFVGRKGWEPFLAPFGYEPVAVIYRKTLRNDTHG